MIAVVASVDRPILGRLGPGAIVHLVLVDAGTAREALRRDRELFEEARAHLREAEGWDALWHGAGG